MESKAKKGFLLVLLAGLIIMVIGCAHSSSDGGGGGGGSSRAYTGHASDADVNAFVDVYGFTKGTRLDDCQTCHTGGTVHRANSLEIKKSDTKDVNPCDWCHFIVHPDPDYTGLPTNYAQTLNPYGADYKAAGRDKGAVKDIADTDSDNDSFSNEQEIEDLRYPGSALSYPGLPVCPTQTVTMNEIRNMPRHTQFSLSNANKQQFDFYATYTGVKIKDLLAARGIDLSGVTSIDVMAPDGFARSFSLDEINNQFPAHQFFSGYGVADLGADCSFVDYPIETYGLGYGDYILDEQWHILAFKREGEYLDPAYLDVTSGKINGEGPFRNVIPPASTDPALNSPDRGKYADTTGCTLPDWDYNGTKDHNAGSMVKAVVIIRINPMPVGCEPFDIQNGGWALVDAEELLIYGHNVGQ